MWREAASLLRGEHLSHSTPTNTTPSSTLLPFAKSTRKAKKLSGARRRNLERQLEIFFSRVLGKTHPLVVDLSRGLIPPYPPRCVESGMPPAPVAPRAPPGASDQQQTHPLTDLQLEEGPYPSKVRPALLRSKAAAAKIESKQNRRKRRHAEPPPVLLTLSEVLMATSADIPAELIPVVAGTEPISLAALLELALFIAEHLHESFSELPTYRAEEDGQECRICLSNIQQDEGVSIFPLCLHTFHTSCVDSWLEHKMECPLCRSPIPGTLSRNLRTAANRR